MVIEWRCPKCGSKLADVVLPGDRGALGIEVTIKCHGRKFGSRCQWIGSISDYLRSYILDNAMVSDSLHLASTH